MELQGKAAIVTGAGSGIGRATAIRLAEEGAHVGLLDIDPPSTRALAVEIRKSGGRAEPLIANVADATQMTAAFDEFVAVTNRLDLLVCNAGINGSWAPIDELTPQEWEDTVSVNLRGAYLTLHFGVPHMKRARGGAIVLVSSVNGTRVFSNAGATAYSATKAAQLTMAKMLALELAKYAIRVNAICPGWIATNIPFSQRRKDEAGEPVQYPTGSIPLTRGRPGKPQDVAELILFLLSSRSKHITGSPVWIDGGESLITG